MKAYVTLLWLSGCMVASATAQPDWQCRNHEFEISCNSSQCERAESHTPMDIYLSDQEISVCAYTGCWEGRADTASNMGRFLTYTGLDLPFSTQADAKVDLSVTIDTENGVGTVLVAGLFVTPLTCSLRG